MPGTVLKKIRLQCNYSQAACAEALGISQVAYSKIENNETELKIRHCKILSILFKQNIYDLLDEDFEIHKPKVLVL